MNFQELLNKCAETAYPEPKSSLHEQLTPNAVNRLCIKLKKGDRILDLGCGNGVSMRLFRDKGMIATGASVLKSEVQVLKEQGLIAVELEMHEVDRLIERFDGVFARHVLEHSPCPLLVLNKINSVLNTSGWLYVEVPLPDTACHHELNKNHYSVLSPLGWAQLISRSGFKLVDAFEIDFEVMAGKDCYQLFLAQKI